MTNTALENIVIVLLIALGVGLGIYFRTAGDSQLAAVLLAIALAAILYKFLGGNKESNSFSVGFLKFGGSAAVLGGFMWLMAQVIFKNEASVLPADARVSVSPATGWYAADLNNGTPVPVEVLLGDSAVYFVGQPANRTLAERSFRLENSEGDRLPLLPYSGGDTLGYVPRDNVRELGGGTVDNSGAGGTITSPTEVTTFVLYPNDRQRRSTTQLEKRLIRTGKRESPYAFPFELRTFGSSFKVQERDGGRVLIEDREVRRNLPFVVESAGRQWLIFAMHANFLLEPKDQFSEWAVVGL